MAALTAASQRNIRHIYSYKQNWRMANAVTAYVGSFLMIPGTGGFTSTRGYARPWDNVATSIWAGIAEGSPFNISVTNSIVGDTGAAPVVEVSAECGPLIINQYAVTGVSAQADVRLAVYATNDNDLTVTANLAPAVGRIVYWYSSTTADVAIYGFLASVVI